MIHKYRLRHGMCGKRYFMPPGNFLEFPQKAVVEAEGCPITLFEMDATHELDLEE